MDRQQVKPQDTRASWNGDLNIPVAVGLFSDATGTTKIKELPNSKRTPVKLGGLELMKSRIMHIRLRWGNHTYCMDSSAITYHDIREENGEPVHYFSLIYGKYHFRLRCHALSFAWTLMGFDDGDAG